VKRYTRTDLNKIFAAQSGQNEILFKNYIWFNNSNDSSLRLTLNGYNFLIEKCKLKSFCFKIDCLVTNKLLLQLERYYPSLYFLLPMQGKLYTFDDDSTAMLILMDGDIKTLLQNYENSV
jgi:hypothetical protein